MPLLSGFFAALASAIVVACAGYWTWYNTDIRTERALPNGYSLVCGGDCWWFSAGLESRHIGACIGRLAVVDDEVFGTLNPEDGFFILNTRLGAFTEFTNTQRTEWLAALVARGIQPDLPLKYPEDLPKLQDP